MTEQAGLGWPAPAPGDDPGPVPGDAYPEFYDAIRYWRIPDMARAVLYRDGTYACPPGEATRLGPVRWITISNDFRRCGIADFEPGNPVYEIPGLLREFAAGRLAMRRRARIYTDRNELPRVQAELADLPHELWVATLDGDRLTPDFAPNLWAVQFEGTRLFDRSVLYGDW